MSTPEIPKPNYRSPGGEVIIASFIDHAHWTEAKAGIEAAGISFDRFIGKDGSVQPVRNARREPTSSIRWREATGKLWEDVQEVRGMLDDTPSKGVKFGLAIPNPVYEPPTMTEMKGGGLMISYPDNCNEYEFLRDGRALRERHRPLIKEPETAIQSLAVVLQYRESI